MSKDRAADGSAPADLPDPIHDWIAERAAEQGVTEEELLSRLLSGDGADVDAIEERLADLESDLDEMIEDVRKRVIQVKRETDAKAPADHEHADLLEEVERAAEDAEAAREEVETLDDRMDAGFDNYEAVLEHLVTTSEDVRRKLDLLATAVLDLRERADEVTEAHSRHVALAELTRSANVHGTRKATCADCRESVDLALLNEPRCPHCDETFAGFSPKEGLFGSATLDTGSIRALDSDESDAREGRSDLRDVFDRADAEREGSSPDDSTAADAELAPRTTDETGDDSSPEAADEGADAAAPESPDPTEADGAHESDDPSDLDNAAAREFEEWIRGDSADGDGSEDAPPAAGSDGGNDPGSGDGAEDDDAGADDEDDGEGTDGVPADDLQSLFTQE